MQNTIKETFSLKDVPREAYILGLAGTLPYLATSLSTVYCAWEINHSAATGSGLLMSHNTAEALLHILEPLQIGWGAVVSGLTHTLAPHLLRISRLFPSSAQSTGASSGPDTAATRATNATQSVLSHQQSPGPPPCCPQNMP